MNCTPNAAQTLSTQLTHLQTLWPLWQTLWMGNWWATEILHWCNMMNIPIGSMYAIYGNIWGILMVNVTIYGIHGSYGIWNDLHIYTYIYIYIKYGWLLQKQVWKRDGTPPQWYIYIWYNKYIYIYNSTNTEMNMAVQINYNKLIKPTCPVVIIKHWVFETLVWYLCFSSFHMESIYCKATNMTVGYNHMSYVLFNGDAWFFGLSKSWLYSICVNVE